LKTFSQNPESEIDRRRRAKVIGFIIAESSAIGLLLLLGTIALLARFTDSTLTMSINVLTIAAAAAVALIPIIFFAVTPVIPRQR
jgi:hypothetical protein